MPKEEDQQRLAVTPDVLFQAVVDEARAAYKLIVTMASAFLGGTLLFLEKIAPNPARCSIVVLGLGWSLLICSILCVLRVHYLNLKSGTHVLNGRYELAQPIDEKNDRLTMVASLLLVGGLLAIAVFGIWNLALRTP
jgi:hypothetical protein